MGWIADLVKEIPISVNLQAKLDVAEKEFAALEAEIAELKTENDRLKLDNVNLRQEIQRRDEVIQNEKSHKNPLEDAKLDILKLLFKQEKLQIEQIAQTLNMEFPIIKLHLGDLKKMKFVRDSYPRTKYINQVITEWSLSQEGLRYVTEHK